MSEVHKDEFINYQSRWWKNTSGVFVNKIINNESTDKKVQVRKCRKVTRSPGREPVC